MRSILIINGPNLDLLGKREPHVYGHRSFEDYFAELERAFPALQLRCSQSNNESAIVEHLRGAMGVHDAVVLNAAGYSHTSVAIRDTIVAIGIPVVEVHISNIHDREAFRQNTITGAVCAGVISGFGLEGYRMAIEHLVRSAG